MIDFNEFNEKGYTILPNVIPNEEIEFLKSKLNTIYNTQKQEFTEGSLEDINEQGMVRCPLLYDEYFVNLFFNENILDIVKKILGKYFILSLQNSIIIPPHQSHHQSFYHRDIIYQDFTTSKPLGINVYYCLDDYNQSTGGTCFIPKSHKFETFPKEFHEITPDVPAGSIIFFDSMLYHKAGVNTTDKFRYGINHMFVLPFIKQQIDLPFSLQGQYSQEPILNRILGYQSKEYKSVLDLRNYRLNKLNNE